MISFRFHVVSITAVFLAIALGVVVGTTYVDGAVVDGLRNRIDSVEQNLDDRKAENDRLESELDRARTYIDASADYAVTDRLTDVPVLLLAARGIDEAAVERTVGLSRTAGARTPGVVWLEAPWQLESEEERAALASILDADAGDEADELLEDAWAAISGELAGAGGDPGAAPPVLDSLVDAGFLSVDALDDASTTLADLAGAGPRVVVMTGARAEPGPATLAPVVAAAAVDNDLVTVLADVHVEAPEAPPRGEALLASLSDAVLEVAAVVDNADRTEGQVAAVLAVDAGAEAPVGHLGYGEGAAGVVPAWTPP
jgi:hypothetical protein